MNIKYDLKKFIKKHRMLYYLAICIKNINNVEFYNRVITGVDKKNEFIIDEYGKSNFGMTIYNIEIKDAGSGFFALYRSVLQGLYCAKRGGFVPYVDVSRTAYNNNPYDNMFEYYFEQPSGLTKEIVKNSAFVAKFSFEHRRWVEDIINKNESLAGGYEFDTCLIEELARISKQAIKIKNDVGYRLQEDINKILGKKKTVAVHYRGNAFHVGFYGHPIALKIDDYFEYLDECIGMKFEKIFVATDDMIALKGFIERYGNKVIYYKDVARSEDGIDVHNHKNKMKKTGYELGYEVLRDMHTLASCDGMICGKSQVSISAMVEKRARESQFEYFKLIDKGLYGKEFSKSVEAYSKRVGL